MKRMICPAFLFFLSPYFLSAQKPSGFVAEYPLNNNSAIDISGNSYNGTLNSSTAVANRFSTASSAVQFNSGTSSGTLPLVVQDNFSLGFWIKTTMTAANGSQWYQGQSLIDAEVCGVVNDWGTSLMNTGKVAFGIGNPDRTIISASNYNDGNWHFVTVTRDETAGASAIYVDGSQVATGTGMNTGTLNSPAIIGLGRNNCSGANYTGALDDIIFYNRVLSSTEVTNLFNYMNNGTLPIDWLSFTGKVADAHVNLQWQTPDAAVFAYFEVEHSSDAQNFSVIGHLPKNNGVALAEGKLLYSFADLIPESGDNYYRIKEVGTDGQSSLSDVLHFTKQKPEAAIHLFSDPVHDNLVVINPAQQIIGEMTVMDMEGRVISSRFDGSHNKTILVDVVKLLPGYYLLRVKATTASITIPFIKQ